jgi:hypothetical protein
MIFITEQNNDTLEYMNQITRDWTHRCARGEEYWICADCGSGFPEGMPDKCAYDHQRCTEIIIKDKQLAKI